MESSMTHSNRNAASLAARKKELSDPDFRNKVLGQRLKTLTELGYAGNYALSNDEIEALPVQDKQWLFNLIRGI